MRKGVKSEIYVSQLGSDCCTASTSTGPLVQRFVRDVLADELQSPVTVACLVFVTVIALQKIFLVIFCTLINLIDGVL